MSGRFLTERLLATTSLAALLLAVHTQEASATTPCTVVPAGGSFTNTGSVGCVVVPTSSISVTNSAGATIGPAGFDPLVVTSSGTLTGGITNSGTILGTGGTSVAAVSIEGYVQGGITNSGTISVASTGALFNYGAISVGTQFGPASATSFGGGITNSGTLSVTATGGSMANVMLVNVSTFSGNIVNSGTVAGSATATSSGNVTFYGLNVSSGTFIGNQQRRHNFSERFRRHRFSGCSRALRLGRQLCRHHSQFRNRFCRRDEYVGLCDRLRNVTQRLVVLRRA